MQRTVKGFLAGLIVGLAVWAGYGWVSPAGPETAQVSTHSGTYLELSTNYVQNAAEYRALCFQAFNNAQLHLDRVRQTARFSKPPCVVVDIDETVLDNSRYQGRLVREGGQFPTGWVDWCNLAEATPVPGALEFLRHCDTVGIAVFYVSNRKLAEREGTIRNLRALGFPQVQDDRLLFRTQESSKKNRRAKVEETHSIIMLCGDNLADFNEVFEGGTVASRARVTDSLSHSFGNQYIVLPNPMYGEWYGALINFDYSIPWQEQEAKRVQLIRGF